MSYIINVARKARGNQPPKHIFRTARDSIVNREDAVKIAAQLSLIYPTNLYEINVSHDHVHSEYIDWETENV